MNPCICRTRDTLVQADHDGNNLPTLGDSHPVQFAANRSRISTHLALNSVTLMLSSPTISPSLDIRHTRQPPATSTPTPGSPHARRPPHPPARRSPPATDPHLSGRVARHHLAASRRSNRACTRFRSSIPPARSPWPAPPRRAFEPAHRCPHSTAPVTIKTMSTSPPSHPQRLDYHPHHPAAADSPASPACARRARCSWAKPRCRSSAGRASLTAACGVATRNPWNLTVRRRLQRRWRGFTVGGIGTLAFGTTRRFDPHSRSFTGCLASSRISAACRTTRSRVYLHRRQ